MELAIYALYSLSLWLGDGPYPRGRWRVDAGRKVFVVRNTVDLWCWHSSVDGRGECGVPQVESSRIVHNRSIILHHPSVVSKNTCGIWEHGRLSCVLAELLGDIIIGKSLVGGVIMVVVVTDGRVSPIVYEVPRLECDTHGACECVYGLRLFGGDGGIVVGRGFNCCMTKFNRCRQ